MLDVAFRPARVGGTASAVGFFLSTLPRPRLRARPGGSVLAGAETWGSRSGLNIASSTSDQSSRRRIRLHLVEVALTRCYTDCQMPDDLVIFIRCDSAGEKRAFAAAAKNRGETLRRFAREAMAARAGIKIQDRLCEHCSTQLSKGNHSGFCRKCLRTIGISKLRNHHPR